MSSEYVEVLLRKKPVEDECVVLLKGEGVCKIVKIYSVSGVSLRDTGKPTTPSGPVCPYCGGKPMLLRSIGRWYCFNCKKYIFQ
ncbi:MAG: hypothetical protein QXW40_07205 [Thermofilum sp.]